MFISTRFRPSERYDGDMQFFAAARDEMPADSVHAARVQDVSRIVQAWRQFISADIELHLTGVEHSVMLPDAAVQIGTSVDRALRQLEGRAGATRETSAVPVRAS